MEREFHRWLQERLPQHGRLAVPVGDDAAILQLDATNCVVTTDTISDEVDFHLSETPARAIGHKALGINLSDLAAMAAQPVGCVVNLMLPRENTLELAKEIIEGMLPLAAELDCPIAGGDVHVWDHPLAVTITAMGQVADETSKAKTESQLLPAVRRSGAQPGDLILVTGAVGGSILGRHLNVRPRIREMRAICELCEVHAAIDCSDGLALDLQRMAEASGVGAELFAQQIPIHKDAHALANQTSRSPLDHALHDGEDFELILAVEPNTAKSLPNVLDISWFGETASTQLSTIGRIISESGLWLFDEETSEGRRKRDPLQPKGYEHGN